jgi:PTH1 family peptidyl-tRNA hydrolase
MIQFSNKILIVGLGNPGKKYKNTRHNIGFLVLDKFQKAYSRHRRDGPTGISKKFQYRENNFPEFKLVKKFNSLISEGKISGKKILLAKPQTFMNNSGKAVKSLCLNFFEIKAMAVISKKNKKEGNNVLNKPSNNFLNNLFVVHDDVDLPLGKIKISRGRGSGGHKGVESIIKELGTKNFVRFRIGIELVSLQAQSVKRKAQSHSLKLKA